MKQHCGSLKQALLDMDEVAEEDMGRARRH
jgi:hypothetical protein